jgi:hypothetical protein
MLSDRGHRTTNIEKEMMFNSVDRKQEYKVKTTAQLRSGQKIESGFNTVNTSTAEGQDDQIIDFQRSAFEIDDNNYAVPKSNVLPMVSN